MTLDGKLSTHEIVDSLLQVRRNLFMWSMSLSEVDRLLTNFDYDVSVLPQYIFNDTDIDDLDQDKAYVGGPCEDQSILK